MSLVGQGSGQSAGNFVGLGAVPAGLDFLLTLVACCAPAVAQQTDVFVAMHGANIANAWFMRPGSSMVEVHSPGYPWSDLYFNFNQGDPESGIFWWNLRVTVGGVGGEFADSHGSCLPTLPSACPAVWKACAPVPGSSCSQWCPAAGCRTPVHSHLARQSDAGWGALTCTRGTRTLWCGGRLWRGPSGG